MAVITRLKAKELHQAYVQEAEKKLELEASPKCLDLSDKPLVNNGYGIMEDDKIPGAEFHDDVFGVVPRNRKEASKMTRDQRHEERAKHS